MQDERQSAARVMNQDAEVCAGDGARRPNSDAVEMGAYSAQTGLLYSTGAVPSRMAAFLSTVLALAIAPVLPCSKAHFFSGRFLSGCCRFM